MLIHKTVLLHESIDGLNLKKGSVYVDGTLGSAGHAYAAAEATGGHITIIGFDRDAEALKRAEARLKDTGAKVHFIKQSYRTLDTALAEIGIEKIDALMLDIGLSSDQFETSGRGFTFKKDEPLLMTFKDASDITPDDLTAERIVNTWDEENIADIIFGYGEERYSRRIAKKIVEHRALQPIKTTFELVNIIKTATPYSYHHGKIHPATRTFQALRIAVNDELNALRDGLTKGFSMLASGGRMAIISFHSLEDRIVKNFIREKVTEEVGNSITKKPLSPSDAELAHNPRARSAKLRIIEKI